MKKRALISVSDKTNIQMVGERLHKLGFEIISTGGTQTALENAGIPTVNISEITSFPECLDGRVKTLHPNVHGGLLAMRDNKEHMAELERLNIGTIDVVVVNLYPFKQTIMKEGVSFGEAVENIDIGGPTMLRAAAKNYQDVAVIIDPQDYDGVLTELENGGVSLETKKMLMYKVFEHTSVYDTMIATYLRDKLEIKFPNYLTLAYEKREQLRYGENPHQDGAVYSDVIPVANSLVNAEFLNGKQLSYNNINDTNGAVELLKEFDRPTVVAIKHANPCGVCSADNIYDAYIGAYNADPISIFGGIVAVNGKVDKKTAEEMVKIFLEIVIAPDFDDDALEVLKTKKNLRVLKNKDIAVKNASGLKEMKKFYGGIIMQNADEGSFDYLEDVTAKHATEDEKKTMDFAMKVVKHCKSNAIVLAKGEVTLGIGVGQTNRIWATNQAIEHSTQETKGSVLASDAFFPFNDCVEVAGNAGVTAIVQPGGSIRDKDSVEKCDEMGIAMCFSKIRHFKH